MIIRTRPNSDAVRAIWLNNPGIEIKPSFVARPEIKPAIIAPNEDAKNQIPIICPIYFLGDKDEIVESPIGLRVNSPIVWRR